MGHRVKNAQPRFKVLQSIRQLLKLAAEADPIAQLCINDLSLTEAHNSPEQCAS
jgi:hypothetical protein